ncbi:hypothetical protein EDB83DRAFT_2317804 [Lactarius deliciosus]|nr:hypothetical protein EDB83DRAFT_2317804 [Lactarius deliciosus]
MVVDLDTIVVFFAVAKDGTLSDGRDVSQSGSGLGHSQTTTNTKEEKESYRISSTTSSRRRRVVIAVAAAALIASPTLRLLQSPWGVVVVRLCMQLGAAWAVVVAAAQGGASAVVAPLGVVVGWQHISLEDCPSRGCAGEVSWVDSDSDGGASGIGLLHGGKAFSSALSPQLGSASALFPVRVKAMVSRVVEPS